MTEIHRRSRHEGELELRLHDDGTATLTIFGPCRPFAIQTDSEYRVGDEYVTVVDDERTLFHGSPVRAKRERERLTLDLLPHDVLSRDES